ncbi:protein DpdD [Variovorax sp. RB2P76]|uniref:protein DpdD n=1 Tax=Variovorax sp. RB2P76 TaxID=3443736 RepID=UPI003F48F822
MILTSEDQRLTFLAQFRVAAGVDTGSPEGVEEFDELALTIDAPRLPGCVLAWPRAGKDTVYYAIAETPSQWRRLRPLLLAFVGPTVTTFDGEVSALVAKNPVEGFLLARGFHAVARIRTDSANADRGRRSFRRLLTMLNKAPVHARSIPLSTARLLAKFEDCLNGFDRNGAQKILDTCQSELRLDALNIAFLRVKLLAHFSDWAEIYRLEEFHSICRARNPPQIGVLLLETLYQMQIRPVEAQGMRHVLLAWREETVGSARSLLRLPVPSGTPSGALKLFALSVLDAIPRNLDLEIALKPELAQLDWLGEELKRTGRLGESHVQTTPAVVDPVDSARGALLVAQEDDTLATAAHAIDLIDALSADERAALLGSGAFREMLEALRRNGDGPAIHEWGEWIKRLEDPGFVDASKLAQRLLAETSASDLRDPQLIAQLGTAIESASDAGVAGERLSDALPLLTSWVAEDPVFPRAGMSPVYEALVYRFVLDSRRTTGVFDSSAVVVRALLNVGLKPEKYKALLEDCLELMGGGAGRRSIYWLLDVLEDTVENPTPDEAQRNAFWHQAFARLAPMTAYLTPGQLLVLRRLSESLGNDVILEQSITTKTVDEDQSRTLAQALADTSIAIYTLTESAGRQAAQTLRELVPSVKVNISNDEVGTVGLKNLALTSDIFVMATASAKHAATTFVQQLRPKELPLLFAAGRGFSSIVRVIEEFALGRER